MPYRTTVKRNTMTFQEVHDLVNQGRKVVVYSLTKHAGDSTQAQFMSDYDLCQHVVYAAKEETFKASLFAALGWPSQTVEIVLFDEKSNIIARGFPEQTHNLHVFLTRDDVLAELRRLMEEEADTMNH